MKIIRMKIVNGTTVTTITKGQNNHTLNNNNKYTVEDMRRLVGLSDTVPHLMAGSNVVRCQPTARCVLPPQDGSPILISEVFATVNKGFRFGVIKL